MIKNRFTLSIFMIAQVFSSLNLWGMFPEHLVNAHDWLLQEIAKKAVNYQVDVDLADRAQDPTPITAQYAILGNSPSTYSKEEIIKLSKFFLEETCWQNKKLRGDYLETQKKLADWLTQIIDSSIDARENKRKTQIMNNTNDIEEILKRAKDKSYKSSESPEVNRTPEEKKMHAMLRAGKYCVGMFNNALKEEESRFVNFDPAASSDTWKPISGKLVDAAHTWLQARGHRFMYVFDFDQAEKDLPKDIETLNTQKGIAPFRNVNEKSLMYLHGELLEKINEKDPFLGQSIKKTTDLEAKMKDNEKRAKIVENYLNVEAVAADNHLTGKATKKIDTYTRASIDKAAWLVGNVYSLLDKRDDLLRIRIPKPGLWIQPSFIDRCYNQKQCSLSSQPSAPLYPVVENK